MLVELRGLYEFCFGGHGAKSGASDRTASGLQNLFVSAVDSRTGRKLLIAADGLAQRYILRDFSERGVNASQSACAGETRPGSGRAIASLVSSCADMWQWYRKVFQGQHCALFRIDFVQKSTGTNESLGKRDEPKTKQTSKNNPGVWQLAIKPLVSQK